MADPKKIAVLTEVLNPVDGFSVVARDGTRTAGDRVINIPIAGLADEVKARIAELGILASGLSTAEGDIDDLEAAQAVTEGEVDVLQSDMADRVSEIGAVQAAVSDKVDQTAFDTLEGKAVVNDEVNPVVQVANLQLSGPVQTPVVAATANSLTFDWSVRATHVLTVDSEVTITESNAPGDPAFDDAGREVVLINSTGVAVSLILPAGWLANSNRPVSEVKANERLSIFPRWDGSEVRYSYEGDQSRPLSVTDGGTGGSLGVAEAPTWTVQASGVYSGDQFDINFGEGTFSIVDVSAGDIDIAASSGRPASGVRVQRVLVNNTDASPHSFTLRGQWTLVGLETPQVVPAGGAVALEFWATGSTEDDVYVVALTGAAVVGGDPPPATTLLDGLVAAWPMNDATVATVADYIGSLDLAPNNAARFTAQETGILGDCFACGVGGTTSYLAAADPTFIAIPDSGEVRTYVAWVNHALGDRFLALGSSLTFDPFILLGGGGTVHVWYSTNGSNYPANPPWDTGVACSGGTWTMVAFVVDRAAGQLKVSLNAASYVTKAAAVVLTSNELRYGGSGGSGDAQGFLDQLLVYNRELTVAELEELYGGGTSPVDITTL